MTHDLDTARPPRAGEPSALEAKLLTLWRGLMVVLGGSAAIALVAFVGAGILSRGFHGLFGAAVLLTSLVGSAALVMSHFWLLAALTSVASSDRLVRPFSALAACVALGDIFVLPMVWRAVVGSAHRSGSMRPSSPCRRTMSCSGRGTATLPPRR